MKDEKNMMNLALEAIDFENSEVYESNKEKCFAIPHNCYAEIKIVSSNKKTYLWETMIKIGYADFNPSPIGMGLRNFFITPKGFQWMEHYTGVKFMQESDLIESALKGNRKAQEICTNRMIAIPCPCCGKINPKICKFTDSVYISCQCGMQAVHESIDVKSALNVWNTRKSII